MVHDSAVPIDESSDDSVLISVSDSVLDSEVILAVGLDESVHTQVIIDGLKNGG